MSQLIDFLYSLNPTLSEIGVPNLMSIIWAILISLIGRWLARRSRGWFTAAVQKTDVHINQKLMLAAEWVIYYGILILAISLSLAILGLPVDVLVTILAVVVILVAIALQSSLSNFAATIIFLIFQTFKPGDWVEFVTGEYGQVKEIQMFSTVIVTQEQTTVTIPNGVIMQGNIINYSDLGYRRVDLTITITYQDDLLKAKRILEQILAENEHVLAEPEPVVGVMSLGDKGVDFSVRPFANAGAYWNTHFELIEQIKLRFDEAGIKMPVVQQDIHIFQPN